MVDSHAEVRKLSVVERDPRGATAVTEGSAVRGELGTTGLRRWGGHVRENDIPTFNGKEWIKTLKTMSGDPVLSAVFTVIKLLVLRMEWRVDGGAANRRAKRNLMICETSMNDMSQPWKKVVAEILSEVLFGWSWLEIIYKARFGMTPGRRNGRRLPPSNYNDGLKGWRKLAPRGQATLQEWVFDDEGGIAGFIQSAPPKYESVFLPIERSLHFRVGSYLNNPEGESIIGKAYEPWYYGKNLRRIEAIGAERNVAGLPVMGLPMELFLTTASAEQKALLERIGDDLEAVRMDQAASFMYPRWFDDKTGQEAVKFELVSATGAPANTGEMIGRYAVWSAMTALADFMFVGQQSTGANNLATSKQDLFVAALKAIVDGIAEVFNNYGFPRLLRQNGIVIPLEESPHLVPGQILVADLNQLGTYIQRLSASGMDMFPSETLEDFLLDTAGMPHPTPEERKEARELGPLNQGAQNANQQANDAPPGGQAPNPRKRRKAPAVENTNREGGNVTVPTATGPGGRNG